MFQCPEAGTYLFLVTVSTYPSKVCDLSIKRNGKVVASLLNKETDTKEATTMVSQQCLLDLETSDKVQLSAEAGSGISDSGLQHLTQFTGVLLRPSQDTVKATMKILTEDDGLNYSDGFRGLTPSRGTTPLRGFTPARSREISPIRGINENCFLNSIFYLSHFRFFFVNFGACSQFASSRYLNK